MIITTVPNVVLRIADGAAKMNDVTNAKICLCVIEKLTDGNSTVLRRLWRRWRRGLSTGDKTHRGIEPESNSLNSCDRWWLLIGGFGGLAKIAA